jgi:hypothetical protein
MTANPPPPVVFSKEVQAELQRQGINSLHAPGSIVFLGSSILEPPCSPKWLASEERFEIGAFSYTVSCYFLLQAQAHIAILLNRCKWAVILIPLPFQAHHHYSILV